MHSVPDPRVWSPGDRETSSVPFERGRVTHERTAKTWDNRESPTPTPVSVVVHL